MASEFILNSPKTLNSLNNDMIDIKLPVLKGWNANPITAPRALLTSEAG